MRRKIIVFGIAFVMLFSVAMLGAAACDLYNLDKNLCGYEVCACEEEKPIDELAEYRYSTMQKL